jgi:4-alpha-glucanotransferase
MLERATGLVHEARRALGIQRMAFSIHDASFPAGDFDVGRGTPYSESSLALLRFVAGQGFDILQLGPQGETSPGNPSPYDSAAFSRSSLSIAAAALCEKEAGELLSRADLDRALEERPPASALRADHAFAWRTQRRLLERAFHRFQDASNPARERLRERLAAFSRRHREWLDRDALYDALAARYAGRGFRDWTQTDRRLLHPGPGERETFAQRRRALEAVHGDAIAFHRFVQLMVDEQHAACRRQLRKIGLRVYGDLQIGLADRDVWALQSLFLKGYRLGAPPSRTNPAGQPWGYAVFDPRRYRDGEAAGPVARLLRASMERVFDAYDGVRIDHPHGLVCPWVYRADDPDPTRAVPDGARLFSVADLPRHAELARYDIPRSEQIDRSRSPWDDHWVHDLDPQQVDHYAVLFDEVARVAQRAGGGAEAIVCEVLSTLPLPLERVMQRFGLGRFRVTGKIDPADAEDPYRIEAAQPPDWVMIGNHDTPSAWELLERWTARERSARAAYAADLLEPEPSRRPGFAALLARDPGLLAQAMLAELFVSRSQNVMVFFTDLFGMADSYNRPGTVSPRNWSLRVPPDFREVHRERVARQRALNLPLAFALALRARRVAPPGLVGSLFDEASRLGPVSEAFRVGSE